MGEGFQFIDIIIFAVIAIFLILRLRNVLGRRDGTDGSHKDIFRGGWDRKKSEPDGPVAGKDNVFRFPGSKDDENAPAEEPVGAAEPLSPEDKALHGLHEILKADKSFSMEAFLGGARGAFEMILGAFAAGDLRTLENLLSPDVYKDFANAIEDRESRGESLEYTLVGFQAVEAVDAFMEGRVANVTVKFVTDQVMVVRDEKGEIIDGDDGKVSTNTDLWTFSRDTKSGDPNWSLVSTDTPD